MFLYRNDFYTGTLAGRRVAEAPGEAVSYRTTGTRRRRAAKQPRHIFAARVRASEFTTTRPTEAGLYWRKQWGIGNAELVQVVRGASGALICGYSFEPTFVPQYLTEMHPDTLWAGPVLPPV